MAVVSEVDDQYFLDNKTGQNQLYGLQERDNAGRSGSNVMRHFASNALEVLFCFQRTLALEMKTEGPREALRTCHAPFYGPA